MKNDDHDDGGDGQLQDGSSATTRELLKRYYEELGKKSARWGDLLSENFLLTGTVPKESRGREAYVNNNFFKLVRSLRVKELIVDGEKACALVNYDLISPKGNPFSSDVAEIWKAKDGKLDSVAIYFDTSAFTAFMNK